MVTPGLYRHYKGNDYRVLWILPWWGGYAKVVTLRPDDLVHVCVSSDERLDEIGVRSADMHNCAILTAKWSGGDETKLTYLEGRIVIYVSLSTPGRISARTEKEFEETISDGAPGLRFTRIGD